MTKDFIRELLVSSVLIVLFVLLLNPFHLWMPDPMAFLLVALLIVALGLYVSLVLKERPRDEREQFHILFASRISFLFGMAALALGVIVQSFQHDVDPWLVFVFVVMILGKVAGIFYGRRRL